MVVVDGNVVKAAYSAMAVFHLANVHNREVGLFHQKMSGTKVEVGTVNLIARKEHRC